ncbi:MAG: endonuclease NucS [candidate division WOR-3 bacterium]|nr:endonuclease NucS [candidate division WOR-3 bacterium]MDH5684234.1 endonuclease NucS [candidate division WOR-3 bacterium]
MATEIKVWQIENGKLVPKDATMAETGRTETKDLQSWIKSNPSILGEDILIIGEKIRTKAGELDFLGMDKSGNTIIIELKRGELKPREAFAQAIDYASDISSWDFDNLSEVCRSYRNQPLDEYITENFEDVDLEDISFNQTQRILLVGTHIEESLQRMIEWLSDNYGVIINAVILKYIETKSGDELIARTMIIPEEVEKERTQRQQRKIPMSDEPGRYENDELKIRLKNYLSEDRDTPRRIKEILLPLCLEHEPVKRSEIIDKLVKNGEAKDEGQAGRILTTISRELGIKQRDYLRQVIHYEKPNPWEKENYKIEEKYKSIIKDLFTELKISKKE